MTASKEEVRNEGDDVSMMILLLLLLLVLMVGKYRLMDLMQAEMSS